MAGPVAEDKPHIWDPFRQGNGAGVKGGLGLGLYIVRELVTAHAGSIDVETGKGETTFVMKLPRISNPT
jgi:signal transduction histidine kinase